jgi:hypothetical protein
VAARGAALAAAAAAVLVAGLAGCSTGSGSAAAKHGTSTPRPASSGSPAGQRLTGTSSHRANLEGPTLPDNASAAEVRRIYKPWSACLEAHGVHKFVSKDGLKEPASPVTPAILKSCQRLRPHPPWQEIPAYNPNYNKDMAAWIDCMNARGMGVVGNSHGWTFTGSGHPDGNIYQIQVQCEMQAFGEH